MIIRIAAALLFATTALATAPAHASADVFCEGEGVSVDMLTTRSQVLRILRTVVTIGEERWSSDQSYVQGTPITDGQAFEGDGLMLIDFMDDNFEQIIATLRVFNHAQMSAGVFALEGKGAWIVDCSLRG